MSVSFFVFHQIFNFFKLIFEIFLALPLLDMVGDSDGWLDDDVTSGLTTGWSESMSMSTETVGISESELGPVETAILVTLLSTLSDDVTPPPDDDDDDMVDPP